VTKGGYCDWVETDSIKQKYISAEN
jgi:hypothetical protein